MRGQDGKDIGLILFCVHYLLVLTETKIRLRRAWLIDNVKHMAKKDIIFMLDTAGSTVGKVGMSYFGSEGYSRIWFIFPALRTSHIQ